MGLLRFCVVFLLGLGAALGAYATGGLDYMSRQHYFRSWSEQAAIPKHGMVLRVSGNALNEHCTARYVVDNRSGRRVFVVFAPEEGSGDARVALDDRRDDQQAYGYEGPVDARDESGSYGSDGDAREEFRPADGTYRRDDSYRSADVRYSQDYPEDARDDASPGE